MEIPAYAMGEPDAAAVLWLAIVITTFGPGVDAPGEVDVDVTLTLLTIDDLMGSRR